MRKTVDVPKRLPSVTNQETQQALNLIEGGLSQAQGNLLQHKNWQGALAHVTNELNRLSEIEAVKKKDSDEEKITKGSKKEDAEKIKEKK